MQEKIGLFRNRINFFSRSTPITIALFLLLIGLRYGGMYGFYINGDGKGYYSYLPATFIYHDYHFSFYKSLEEKYYPPNTKVDFMAKLKDGEFVNRCYIGTALLWVPFFLLAHFLSLIMGWPADGFAPAYQYSILIAAIFYLWLGLIFLRKLLLSFGFNELKTIFILVLTVSATPLIFYTIFNPEYTHLYSFTLITIFLFYSKRYLEERKNYDFIISTVLLALIVLVRPINGIVILALPFFAGDWKQLSHTILHAAKQLKILCIAIGLFILVLIPQLVYYHLETGHWLVWSYSNVGFNFKESHFLEALFGYRKGFFIYTPFAFLTLVGFVRLFIKSRYLALSLLIFLVLVVYVISSWDYWWYGMCFSLRPMTEYLTFFAILLGFCFELKVSQFIKVIYGLMLTFTLVFNSVLIYQYLNYIQHWDSMNKERFWKVFLHMADEYRGILWKPIPVMTDNYLSNSRVEKLFQLNSFTLNKRISYSKGLAILLNKTANYIPDSSIFFASAKIMPLANPNGKLLWVISLQKDTSFSYYRTFEMDLLPLYKNQWYKISKLIKVPKPVRNDDFLKIYLWNSSRKEIAVDSLVIEKVILN